MSREYIEKIKEISAVYFMRRIPDKGEDFHPPRIKLEEASTALPV